MTRRPARARSGRRTTLVDCDPQASSLAWCSLRAAHLPRVHALASNDPAHGLSAGWMLRVPPATEVMLIDTPAGLRAHEFERFARHADALVIPVVPSPIDLRATLGFLDMVRKLPEVRAGRLRIALMLKPISGTPVDPECLEAARAAARLCESLGHVVEEAELKLDAAQMGWASFAIMGPSVAADIADRAKLLVVFISNTGDNLKVDDPH